MKGRALPPLLGAVPTAVPLRQAEVASLPQVSLAPDDRILVLAPHPDDETLATGGIIQEAVAKGLPVHVVFLTNGDANEWSFMLYGKRPELGPRAVENMGEVRHNEAVAAARVLGLSPDQLTFLGYPDFGTLQIWYRHWGDTPPYRSLLSRATAVPYPDAFRPGAAYRGQEILNDLKTIIRDFKPTKIFVSHPADQNPDHLALYLFTRVALWELAGELQPELYPYLVHYPHWPDPRGYYPNAALAPPAALADAVAWQAFPLGAGQLTRKMTALQAHQTQYKSNARYLDSFLRTNELFGDYESAVELRPSAPGTDLSADEPAGDERAPEQLTEAERARFVGLEGRTVRLEGDRLVISLEFSSPLANGAEASAYLFGYRGDRPFAEMPKLHVKFSEIAHDVYDQDRKLPPESVEVIRKPKQITLYVPLSLLGDPQRVLISARTYLGDIPLDTISWRVLSLAGDTPSP